MGAAGRAAGCPLTEHVLCNGRHDGNLERGLAGAGEDDGVGGRLLADRSVSGPAVLVSASVISACVVADAIPLVRRNPRIAERRRP
jgi:hypothetical protein